MNISQINLRTTVTPLLADLYTPVGLYLRLRDQYRDTVLMESSGNHDRENNFSYIAVNAVAGIEVNAGGEAEMKLPLQNPQSFSLEGRRLTDVLLDFSRHFSAETPQHEAGRVAQSLFGYTSYDTVKYFEKITLKSQSPENRIPLLRYRLYQYVIAINHFNDEMFLIENHIPGLPSGIVTLQNLISQKNAPVFPFEALGSETSNLTDEQYLDMVEKARAHCYRGDVFQLVLSRRFSQSFRGDDFNVYRALRHINPSPYLFYYDYGDYRLMGSSPESQLIIRDGKAVIHPIAGTFRRSGTIEEDLKAAQALKADPKENAEHTMLVDLARNDLSICGKNTTVQRLKEIQLFSHVIHMVSEVTADVAEGQNPYEMIATTFPQGTLSGAPKYRAMELIDRYEPTSRGYYGGCIGIVGLDGSCNQAIMIRTFLSRNNTLFYQAGAGIVAKSSPQNELNEVHHKLNALKAAISMASKL